MEGCKHQKGPENMFIGELNRMAQYSSMRRHDGVQRNLASGIQQQFPLANCLGRLALRSESLL